MPAFLKSAGYVKLLAELDLLKDGSKSDEEGDTTSLDEVSLGEASSLGSFDADDGSDAASLFESKNSAAATENPFRNASDCVITASISQKGDFDCLHPPLNRFIRHWRGFDCVGVVKDALSSHAVYAVTVKKTCGAREIDNWIVYRRYSDFHDFHARMESKVSVASFSFPPPFEPLPVCLFVCMLACLFVCVFVCLCVCVFACLFVCLFCWCLEE